MKLLHHFLYFLTLTVIAVSCTSGAARKAESDFKQVDVLVVNREFTSAMELLDSMMVWNKEDFGVVGEALRRKNALSADYHKQALEVCKSRSIALEGQVQPLTRDFRLTPGEAGMPGLYEPKRQTVETSWNRTYLKISLNETGEVWLTSHYYGQSWIDHVSLRVYDKENFVQSDTIPLSDAWNRKVEDLGDKWETIEFREGTDAGIMAFIADNCQKTIKVRFNGKTFQYIVLEAYDKDAIRKGWELAQLLKELYGLRKEMEQHQKELRKLGINTGS